MIHHDHDAPASLGLLLEAGDETSIDTILDVVRQHMGMDVAFIGEFSEGRRVFRHVSAASVEPALAVGAGDVLDETYCRRIADGRLEGAIPDARAHPQLRDLDVTAELDIRAYVGAPVVFSDGRLYGTLCSFSHRPDPSVTERDAQLLRVVADLVAERLEREAEARDAYLAGAARIDAAVEGDQPEMVFQPIVELDSGQTVGYEALARFTAEPFRPPDQWFAEAGTVGRALALELKAVSVALGALEHLPADVHLALNVSPVTLCSAELGLLLADVPAGRVVVELTEHDQVGDVGEARAAIQRLGRLGVAVASDDTGAGYAGLVQLVELGPTVVKLDRAIVSTIDQDPVRHALVAAATAFARSVGATLVAEGIETEGELEALRAIGVHHGQGYLLGRPGPLPIA
ncbi:MAG: EAL domain-containing protein [Actinomycetota bacterium]|nr:EAL domain-containing protein [Actinomycetota bacterium]